MSVRWLVGWLVGLSVMNLFCQCFLGSFGITAPAQSHVTDSAVYTALFFLAIIANVAGDTDSNNGV